MRKSSSGVTLLELLVAVSLFSLLSVGILTALRVGVNAMGTANTRLMENRRMAGAQQILEEEIAGFMPVVVDCLPEREDQPSVRLPFFQGDPQSMRFVSSFSLGEGWRGLAQVIELRVVPGASGKGVRLIMNEHPYTGSRSAGAFCLGTALDENLGVLAPLFRPIQVGPTSFVLADRLAACRFSYRQTLPLPVGERWVQRWIVRQWPEAVRIDMAPLEPDRVRIRPMPMVAPIRVNSEPGESYGS